MNVLNATELYTEKMVKTLKKWLGYVYFTTYHKKPMLPTLQSFLVLNADSTD